MHWFDKFFHGREGPANWAKAKLVRYADDLVVLARYQGARLRGWLEGTLEGRMGLKVNREKTRVVALQEEGAQLDFLGFTFAYRADLQGRGWRYLEVSPSKKALSRERQRLREMTAAKHCFKPAPALICEINRHLHGWARYFNYGYPRMAFRHLNFHVRKRLSRHLRRRSQRRYRTAEGVSFYRHLAQLGLVYL